MARHVLLTAGNAASQPWANNRHIMVKHCQQIAKHGHTWSTGGQALSKVVEHFHTWSTKCQHIVKHCQMWSKWSKYGTRKEWNKRQAWSNIVSLVNTYSTNGQIFKDGHHGRSCQRMINNFQTCQNMVQHMATEWSRMAKEAKQWPNAGRNMVNMAKNGQSAKTQISARAEFPSHLRHQNWLVSSNSSEQTPKGTQRKMVENGQ